VGGVRRPVIALTSGEPAGVGPELCAMLARQTLAARVVLLGDAGLLAQRGASPATEIEHVPLAAPSVAGKLDPANARYVLALLDRAADGCLAGEFDAMVTPSPATPSTSPRAPERRTW
jgi:4-hydroxythreonine-4-phosphate dehydrogenase